MIRRAAGDDDTSPNLWCPTYIIFLQLELTRPWDSNVARNRTFRLEKYSSLVADPSRRFTFHYYPDEISVRGQVSKGNRARLKSLGFHCVEALKF